MPGSFGAVYLGKLNQSGKVSMLVAVKVHHPGYAPDHMLIDEYNFLKLLGGKHNVIELLTHVYDSQRKIIHFIYPFFEETPFCSLIVDATTEEVRAYMRTLLTTLTWLHLPHNIIHKDVKWNNFLLGQCTVLFFPLFRPCCRQKSEIRDVHKIFFLNFIIAWPCGNTR